jgi:HAE1 family hydrophobic/amphiphilic exporter-1
MLVDSTVVIVEAIHRQWTAGRPLLRSVEIGLAEVFRPLVLFMTILILAFAPMFLGHGPIGSLFMMIPLPLMFALVVGLVGAVMFIPAHVLQWSRSEGRASTANGEAVPQSLSSLERTYAGLVGTLIGHKRRTLAVMVFLLTTCLILIGLSLSQRVRLIDVTLFEETPTVCQVQVIMPEGATIDETDRMLRDLSILFLDDPAGETGPQVTALAGRFIEPDGLILSGDRYGHINIPLRRHDSLTMMDTIRLTISEHLDASVADLQQRPRIRVLPMQGETPLGLIVGLKVYGSDRDQVREATDRLVQTLTTGTQARGLIVLGDDRPMDIRTGRYTLKPSQVQEPGVADRVTEILAAAGNGVFVGKFQTTTGDLDLNVQLKRRAVEGQETPPSPDSLSDLYDLPVIGGDAETPVRSLGNLVMPDQDREPEFKRRVNGMPAMTIWGLIVPGSGLSAQRLESLAAEQLHAQLADRSGVSLTLIGRSPEAGERFNSFFIGLFIVSFVIYLILGLRFGDFIQPLIVFTALAFPIIGVTVGLVSARLTFTAGGMMALVGIALVALCHTLMIVEGINARIRDGLELDVAIIEACTRRIKPVLLTTVALMLWLLPMALGLVDGGSEWTGMARTFIIGMGLTTLLTVCVVPVHYAIACQIKNLFTGDPV